MNFNDMTGKITTFVFGPTELILLLLAASLISAFIILALPSNKERNLVFVHQDFKGAFSRVSLSTYAICIGVSLIVLAMITGHFNGRNSMAEENLSIKYDETQITKILTSKDMTARALHKDYETGEFTNIEFFFNPATGEPYLKLESASVSSEKLKEINEKLLDGVEEKR